MNYMLYTVAVNLMEYWILILITQYICSAHLNLRRRNVLICSAVAVACTVSDILLCGEVSTTISLPLAVVLSILLFSRKRLSDLLRFVAAFAVFFAVMVIPLAILDTIWPGGLSYIFPGVSDDRWLSLILDIITLIALILLGRLLSKYQISLHFQTKEILGSIALAIFAFIDLGLIMFLYAAHLSPRKHYIVLIAYLAALAFCIGYFVYNIVSSRKRIYREALTRSETEYLRLQLDSLQDVKEQEEQVMRMRHDLSSHMAMLQTMFEEGNYEEARKYTKQLSHDVIPSGDGILTGNKAADLVVRSRMKICEEHGIDFTFTGALTGLEHMTAPDICGLLSNAYDNAIEACLPQTGAYIHTTINTTRNYTVVQIVNSVEKKVAIRSNSASTTKKDRKSHGYGIDIMKRIAYKYNGSCSLHCDNREFTVKITLLNASASGQ